MKKTISMFLLATMFAFFAPVMPSTSAASLSVDLADADFAEFYLLDESYELAEASLWANSAVVRPCPSGTYRVRGRTSTKRKVVGSLVTGGIGTAIGAGIGGKRGALIGLGSGAGGYLVYRYIKDSRGRCVRSYRRG